MNRISSAGSDWPQELSFTKQCMGIERDQQSNQGPSKQKSLVLLVLPYSSETWTLLEEDKSRLRVFKMAVLRTEEDLWSMLDI